MPIPLHPMALRKSVLFVIYIAILMILAEMVSAHLIALQCASSIALVVTVGFFGFAECAAQDDSTPWTAPEAAGQALRDHRVCFPQQTCCSPEACDRGAALLGMQLEVLALPQAAECMRWWLDMHASLTASRSSSCLAFWKAARRLAMSRDSLASVLQ